MDIDEVSSKKCFAVVKSCIKNIIIKDRKVVSMNVLQQVYDKLTTINCNRNYKKNFQGFFSFFNQVKCVL